MPIKRSPEEGSRPPLSRGSACHRCFARKVRCSGQPSPETGLNACTSCLRTARFKGHDLAHARCAFQGEGLCSEEGGPSMTGEIYSNVGPAPRRKLTSRSSTNTSVSSTRSAASAVSNATDYSFDSVGTSSLISPVSSTGSLKSMGDGAASTSSSPETLSLAPPGTYQLPPALPPYAVPGIAPLQQQQQAYYPSQPSTSSLPPTSFPPHAPFPGTFRTASDPSCAKSLLSRRTKASPMSIALPPQPSMIPSPTVPRGNSPVNPASAPLAVPQNWGPPTHHHQQQQQQQHRHQHHQPQPLPLQHHQPQHPHSHPHHSQQHTYPSQYAHQDDLAGAMQSVLTPSTLSKLPGAQSSSYDFPLPSEAYAAYGGAPTPALGYGGAMHLGAYGSHGMSSSALPPTPLRSLSVSELYPPSSYAQAPPPPPQASTAGVEYDAHAPVAWSTSFHLPSPGVTFTSSTPHWLAHGGGVAAAQYFQV
ncbi:hypothetical protein JCM8208_007029 [Rhodotorula glutinis]